MKFFIFLLGALFFCQTTFAFPTPTSPYIEKATNVGIYNLEWLNFLNAQRSPKYQLFLTSVSEMPKYPIDQPDIYSPKTIEADYKDIEAKLPAPMTDVLLKFAPYISPIGLSDDTYLKWAKAINKLYNISTRWKLIAGGGYLPDFAKHDVRDIRGYYELSREADLQNKLHNWSELSNEDQQRFKNDLIGMCRNSETPLQTCKKSFAQMLTQNKAFEFYQKYFSKSEKVYNRFFQIEAQDVRKDIHWTSEHVITVPFHHTDPKIEAFLKDNLEDEWHWGEDQLKLQFTDNAEIKIEFQVGALPHVPDENPSEIVMDKNASLDEWNTKYAIRHEFGHILGFMDCYVEFYNIDKQEMIAYQLDTSNLMCSRAGRMTEGVFIELKRAYKHP